MSELQHSYDHPEQYGWVKNGTIKINGEAVSDSPALSIDAKKVRQMEELNWDVVDFAEHYAHISPDRLDTESPDELAERLTASGVPDDLISVAIWSWQESGVISKYHARDLIRAASKVCDVVAIPLQPKKRRAFDGDEDREFDYFENYRDSVLNFVEAYEEMGEPISLFCSLPRAEWKYVEELVTEYLNRGHSHFVINFDRTDPTAHHQAELLSLLRFTLRARGIEDDVLLYGVNMSPRGQKLSDDTWASTRLPAIGMGVDILGPNHVPPRWIFAVANERDVAIGELFDGDDEPPRTIQVINEDGYVREVSIDEFEGYHHPESSIEVDRIMDRISPESSDRNRMAKLIRTERLGIMVQDIRERLDRQPASKVIEEELLLTDSHKASIELISGIVEGTG